MTKFYSTSFASSYVIILVIVHIIILEIIWFIQKTKIQMNIQIHSIFSIIFCSIVFPVLK